MIQKTVCRQFDKAARYLNAKWKFPFIFKKLLFNNLILLANQWSAFTKRSTQQFFIQ